MPDLDLEPVAEAVETPVPPTPEELLDEFLEETFPASDPVASGVVN